MKPRHQSLPIQRGALPDPGIHSLCWHALGLSGTEYAGTESVCSPLKEEGIAQELGHAA